MAKKQIKSSKQVKPAIASANIKTKTIGNILLKVIITGFVIISIVSYTDYKGYFNPDYSNDHTRKKWKAYYEFKKHQPVDVVLIGNSHLYTGISPENLSNALGANCFILASPGTTMTDAYFSLKEAITVCKPKIAIVETFTMNNYVNHELKSGSLSDQFKSFSARKNISQKLTSTPILFTSDNYLPAWSNTIRNHSFIFNNTDQIRKNIELGKQKEPENQGLYLGRFIRFTSGIEDSTLLKYNKPGFVAYDYNSHLASKEAKKYLLKTIELCKQNQIKLVFLTLPMYYRHVHNYDLYKKDLLTVLKNTNQNWLDLQLPYDTTAFTAECFENTVGENQHMTYYGSRVAAYKLANYINLKLPGVLPNRYADLNWKQLFYGSDGYFENYPPENDGISQILVQNQQISEGLNLKEMSFVPVQGAKQLIVKIDKKNSTFHYGKTLKILTQSAFNGETGAVEIIAKCNLSYDPSNHYVFVSDPMNPALSILKILNISIL